MRPARTKALPQRQPDPVDREQSPISLSDSSSDRREGIIPTHDSDASVSTVMSDQSSSSEEEESLDGGESDTPFDLTIAQLEMEFKERDEMLNKLAKGIDPMYIQVMRDNEVAARRQKILRVKERHERQKGFSSFSHSRAIDALDQQTIGSDNENTSFLRRLRLAFMCDFRITLAGAGHLLFYCVAHLSCFQVIEGLAVALTKGFSNQPLVEVSIILGCILLLRVTGGIWDYLVYESYLAVKFDMHNRLRLGKLDARVALWFRQHGNIRELLNLIAFYATMESMASMHWRIIERADRSVLLLFDALGKYTQQVFGDADTCAVDGVCDVDIEAFMDSRSYSLHYATSAIIAIVGLRTLGHAFLER